MRVPRSCLALFALLVVPGCQRPPDPVPKPALTVTVSSEPGKAQVLLGGQRLGETPRVVGIPREDDLLKLTATYEGQELAEKRIRFLSFDQAEVIFIFGKGSSVMAKALGLPQILVFDYGAGVTFDLNRAELKPDFLPLLERQSRLLTTHFSGLDVHVCGHTDNLGTPEHNMSLSLDRATAVARQLTAHGVPAQRLKIQGFASQYPVADNGLEAGRALNRRTEVVLPQ